MFFILLYFTARKISHCSSKTLQIQFDAFTKHESNKFINENATGLSNAAISPKYRRCTECTHSLIGWVFRFVNFSSYIFFHSFFLSVYAVFRPPHVFNKSGLKNIWNSRKNEMHRFVSSICISRVGAVREKCRLLTRKLNRSPIYFFLYVETFPYVYSNSWRVFDSSNCWTVWPFFVIASAFFFLFDNLKCFVHNLLIIPVDLMRKFVFVTSLFFVWITGLAIKIFDFVICLLYRKIIF